MLNRIPGLRDIFQDQIPNGLEWLAATVPHWDGSIWPMRRFFIVVALFVALLVVYWASPFVSLHRMAANIEARDIAAMSEQVDFVRLRRSLTEEVVTAYLRFTGREKLGVLVASALGASIVDPLVAQIVNPESLMELLRGGSVATDLGVTSFNLGELPATSLASIWNAWLGADYQWERVWIALPVNAPRSEQFRLQMNLINWRWKLTGIELSEKLRTKFAQELAKKIR
jgi:hypothetical protein